RSEPKDKSTKKHQFRLQQPACPYKRTFAEQQERRRTGWCSERSTGVQVSKCAVSLQQTRDRCQTKEKLCLELRTTPRESPKLRAADYSSADSEYRCCRAPTVRAERGRASETKPLMSVKRSKSNRPRREPRPEILPIHGRQRRSLKREYRFAD